MRERDDPMTQTMNASDVRDRWSQVLTQVLRKETRVLIEKSGLPVAAIVSAEDLARLKRFDEQRAAGLRVLDASQAAFADESADSVQREIEAAIAAVRRERGAKTG